MCEISLNTLSEEDNILVLGLQNGSFSIYSLNNFENKYGILFKIFKPTFSMGMEK